MQAGSTMTIVPLALQAVFLASNRGQEVHKPPPGGLANKVFRFRNPRQWFLRNQKIKRAKTNEERTSETASDTLSPISNIYVSSSGPTSLRRRGKGRSPCLERVDSTVSSVTFQVSSDPIGKTKKSKVRTLSLRLPFLLFKV
jgi:hypothetical protein